LKRDGAGKAGRGHDISKDPRVRKPPAPAVPINTMVTTTNISLNLILAGLWFGRDGITGCIDHTFKMDAQGHPYIVISVMAPNASAKRLVFGMVKSTNARTSAHCIHSVMAFCRNVAALYQHKVVSPNFLFHFGGMFATLYAKPLVFGM